MYLREALLKYTVASSSSSSSSSSSFQTFSLKFSVVHCCLFFCLHFADGRHYHRLIFRYPHGLQFGRVQVFPADHMHACSRVHHKLSFLRVSCGCGRQNPLLIRRIECSFVFLFELVDILGKSPRASAGTSLLSFSLFPRSVLKFHSEGTALVTKIDLYHSEGRTFVFFFFA